MNVSFIQFISCVSARKDAKPLLWHNDWGSQRSGGQTFDGLIPGLSQHDTGIRNENISEQALLYSPIFPSGASVPEPNGVSFSLQAYIGPLRKK